MKRVNISASEARKGRLQIENNPVWSALMMASSAEIDAYLAANVTTVAQMRPLLRSLLVTVRYLLKQQQPT